MAEKYQLRARISDRDADGIDDLSDDRDISNTDAERAVVREGLVGLGYVTDGRTDAEKHSQQLLRYARLGGSVLGFVGLILIGYGLFGAAAFRFTGFGLLLAGFGLIAGSEFAPIVRAKLRGEADTDGTGGIDG